MTVLYDHPHTQSTYKKNSLNNYIILPPDKVQSAPMEYVANM